MANRDRYPHESSISLDQNLLDKCHENLVCQLEMICDIYLNADTLHLSDRNKYVGSIYYDARINFPIIKRTVGDFLSPTIEFSDLQLEISNVDGKFNDYLPGGSNYASWIGSKVVIRVGLRDLEDTYRTIFEGFITGQGGFSRSTKSISITARDKFDRNNLTFPTKVFTNLSYPNIEDDLIGKGLPIIYGDWTVEFDPKIGASVPGYVVNGLDPFVNGETSNTKNIQIVISDNALKQLDINNVYFRRSDQLAKVNPSDISQISSDQNSFEVSQNSLTEINIDGEKLLYNKGDEFFVRVIGKDLGVYTSNIIEIARDILITYGGFFSTEFSSSWDTYKNKNSPDHSNIFNIPARCWVQESQSTIEYALSLLEQVRMEVFIDSSQKVSLLSLHFEDWQSNPPFAIRNWDIVKGTFNPAVDDRNNINRLKADYNFLPSQNENFYSTRHYKNQASIDQTGVTVSKIIVFPNLYLGNTVTAQLKEILKITSGYIEVINTEQTWRSLLIDIGQFVTMEINIQGIEMQNVPCLIREIGYDPQGLKLVVKYWSMQMLPFPGYTPNHEGTVGGFNAILSEEI